MKNKKNEGYFIADVTDIHKLESLYLTSGGRIVLDRHYGEYFNETDTKLFSIQQLCKGIKLEEFKKELSKAERRRLKTS